MRLLCSRNKALNGGRMHFSRFGQLLKLFNINTRIGRFGNYKIIKWDKWEAKCVESQRLQEQLLLCQRVNIANIFSPLLNKDRELIENVLRNDEFCLVPVSQFFSFEVRVREYGRLNNNMMQMVSALFICKKLRIERLVYPLFSWMKEPIREDGDIRMVPSGDAQNLSNAIEGYYFYIFNCFNQETKNEFLGNGSSSARALAREYIRPIFDVTPPAKPLSLADVVVHLRGGDAFSEASAHPGYYQPPLAFYKKAIREHRKRFSAGKVILVFEDRTNPCLEPFESWMQEEGIPWMGQSASLKEDYGYILNAFHLVVSRGTFYLSAIFLSDNLKSIYIFDENSLMNEIHYSHIEYIHVMPCEAYRCMMQPWLNSPAQREYMLSYGLDPADNIL